MSTRTPIHPRLRAACLREWQAATLALRQRDRAKAAHHLARLHHLGAHFTLWHMRAHWGYLRLAVMGRHANRVLMEAALTVLTLATPVIAPFLTDLDADATLPPDLRFERAEQSFRRWPLPAPCKRLVLAARRRAAAAP